MSLQFRPFGIRTTKRPAKDTVADNEEPEEYRCIGFPYSAYDAESIRDKQVPRNSDGEAAY